MDIKSQPTLNIGCLGSVSHGKSTMVKLLSGKSTQQHSKEKVRNITMKVGYANCKIYEYDEEYNLEGNGKLVNHISFVDCPGHHELIEVMMSGANLMDYGIVVVAGNQCIEDQPQLRQHILTAKIVGLKKLIFVLNKIDLITRTLAQERKYQLEEYLKEFGIKDPVIIPMALAYGINKEYLLSAIMKEFVHVERKSSKNVFVISRSFDINKPGINVKEMKGGVVGGSLLDGELKVDDEVVISPGQMKYDKSKNEWYVKPHKTKIVSLKSENNDLDNICCGGLTAVGLEIDPYFTETDKLKGNVLHKGDDIKIFSKIECDLENIKSLAKNNIYQLQIGCNTVNGKLLDYYTFELNKPVCCNLNDKILVCNKEDKTIEIVSYGKIISGKEVNIIN